MSLINNLAACHCLLTVEIDVTQPKIPVRAPAPLNIEQAQSLGNHIGEELNRIMGNMYQFGLVTVGALYDTTEMLQPEFPIFEVMEQLYKGIQQGDSWTPQLLAIGSEGDTFPVEHLTPQRLPGGGPLYCIPVSVVGPAEQIAPFAEELETALLEKGRASSVLSAWLSEHFGIAIATVTFATLADLCALMKIQLEQNGHEALWNIVEALLFPKDEAEEVITESGNSFVISGKYVHTPTYSYKEFVQRYSEQPDPKNAYLNWIKIHRQYIALINRHGSGVAQYSVSEWFDESIEIPTPLDADYFSETVFDHGLEKEAETAHLTEHYVDELGTIAYTLRLFDGENTEFKRMHYYAINPDGFNTVLNVVDQKAQVFGWKLDIDRAEDLVIEHDQQDLCGLPEPWETSASPTKH